MKKRILSLILTLCMVAAMATVLSVTQVAAATVVDSGNWGSNITWSLDSDGTMTISGNGDMIDGPATTNPCEIWGDDIPTLVKKLVIEDGVTHVGGSAFVNFDNLTSVEIAGSVTSIDECAFACCDQLTNVYFFGDPTNIYQNAFIDCPTDLKLWGFTGSNVETYCASENLTFAPISISGTCGDNGENVTWTFDAATGTLTVSGTGAMADYQTNQQPWVGFKDMIKKIVIEDGVTRIGNIAFITCENLTDVIFPESIRSIGTSAFQDCEELTSVTFPGYVTSIEQYAFFSLYHNGKLASVTFAAGVGSIGGRAFSGKAFTSLTVTADVGSIGMGAFCNCTELTSVTFSGKVGTTNSQMFNTCNNLQTVTFSKDVESIAANVFGDCEKLESITFVGEVGSIKAQAFWKLDNLKYIYFFGNVNAIEINAFCEIDDTCVIYCYTDNSVLQNAENITVKPLNGELGNITWKLTADGTLTVSGSGDLSSLPADTAPWKSLVDNGLAKNVIIDSNVTGAAALFTGYHTVTFNAGNSTVYTPVLVADGETVPEPADPTRLGYSFAGWYNGDAKYDFTTKITADLNLTAKWEKPDYANELEQAQKDLKDAIGALEGAVAQNKTDVTDEIATVNAAITDLQTALATKASQADLDSLKTSVDDISSNIGTIQGTLAALNIADANLQKQIDGISTNLNSLQTELTTLKNRIAALETSVNNLRTAQATLEAALANKAGKDELQTVIDNLNTAINKLNTMETNLAGTDAALTKRIDDLIDGSTGTLKDAEDRLAALEAQVSDIGGQITNLEAAQKQLENDLATKANATDVTKNVNALHDEIGKLTAALNGKASQTDYDTLKAAVSALQSAVATLNAAKDDYATADAALEDRLNEAIKNANDAQDAVIEELKTRLSAAEAEIENLKTDKADAAALTAAVEKLQKAIDALETVKGDYKGADDALKAELTKTIESAKNAAISAANSALEKAKKELGEAIGEKADATALSDAIDTLNKAISAAQKAAQDYADGKDAELKTTLETAISDAQTALQAAIDTVQENLGKAVSDLAQAITDGDKDLSDKIAALNTALETAKTALEKADSDNKTELNQAITDAQTALQAAIDKVASDLAAAKSELEAKDAELEGTAADLEAKDAKQQTFITIVCVIACLSLAGNVAIVTVIFVLKRKH